jgi:hypothetical protein
MYACIPLSDSRTSAAERSVSSEAAAGGPHAYPCTFRAAASRPLQPRSPAHPELSQGTRSIRAARPLVSRRLHTQSVGVLTSGAAFPRTAPAFPIA